MLADREWIVNELCRRIDMWSWSLICVPRVVHSLLHTHTHMYLYRMHLIISNHNYHLWKVFFSIHMLYFDWNMLQVCRKKTKQHESSPYHTRPTGKLIRRINIYIFIYFVSSGYCFVVFFLLLNFILIFKNEIFVSILLFFCVCFSFAGAESLWWLHWD